jgi:hypothetical protein
MAEQARQLTDLMHRYNAADSFESAVPVVQPRVQVPAIAAAPERRAGARPWAAKTKTPVRQHTAVAKQAAPAQPVKAVANGSDADWMEF